MRWVPALAAAAILASAVNVSVAAPSLAECMGQPNRFPSFERVAPSARQVVIGTVTQALDGHEGHLATFRLRVDEVLRGDAPDAIDLIGVKSGMPLAGARACRQNAFMYARLGDVLAVALDGRVGGVDGVNTYAFIEGRPERVLVRAERLTTDEARAAVGAVAPASPEGGVVSGVAAAICRAIVGAIAMVTPRRTFATREASDAYWMGLAMGGSMEGYGSLASIVAASDLIVVGRPTGLRPYPRDASSMLMTVTLDDVVHGDPVFERPGTVDVLMDIGWGTVEDFQSRLPTGERSLFVLANLGRLHAEVDAAADEVAETQAVYVRLNDPQGQVRDIHGRAVALPGDVVDWSRFPRAYAGRPFQDMVQAMRRAARKADRTP